MPVKQDTQTVPQGPHQIATVAETELKFKRTGRFGYVCAPAIDIMLSGARAPAAS